MRGAGPGVVAAVPRSRAAVRRPGRPGARRERQRRPGSAPGAGRRAPPGPWPGVAAPAAARARSFPEPASRHLQPGRAAPGRAARRPTQRSAGPAGGGGWRLRWRDRAPPWSRHGADASAPSRTMRRTARAAGRRRDTRRPGGRPHGAAAPPAPPSAWRRPRQPSHPRPPRSAAGQRVCHGPPPSLLLKGFRYLNLAVKLEGD